MDLILERFQKGQSGIFSYLLNESGEQIAVTATHAYPSAVIGEFEPKAGPGRYLCVRGMHMLADGIPFVTFEITGIDGHSGILFHKGNLPEEESAGCELVGTSFGQLNGEDDVTQSGLAFEKFMTLQQDVENFWLTIE